MKATYCATMDGKDAWLVATVPGIEVHIDSRSKYVLVDISLDHGTQSLVKRYKDRLRGIPVGHEHIHEHLTLWPKSVIIVCEEVDTFPQQASDTDRHESPLVMR